MIETPRSDAISSHFLHRLLVELEWAGEGSTCPNCGCSQTDGHHFKCCIPYTLAQLQRGFNPTEMERRPNPLFR